VEGVVRGEGSQGPGRGGVVS
jgi:hypothetical protein